MTRPPLPARPAPDCAHCRSFYITHEPRRPHGCRTFGFTSLRMPRDEVRLSTGEECAAFEPRPKPKDPAGPGR